MTSSREAFTPSFRLFFSNLCPSRAAAPSRSQARRLPQLGFPAYPPSHLQTDTTASAPTSFTSQDRLLLEVSPSRAGSFPRPLLRPSFRSTPAPCLCSWISSSTGYTSGRVSRSSRAVSLFASRGYCRRACPICRSRHAHCLYLPPGSLLYLSHT